MAEIDDLRQQALDAIQEATDYLNHREYLVTNLEERDAIREHKDWMEEARTVFATTAFRTTEPDTEVTQLANDLSLTKKLIGSFHENSPFGDVDQSLQDLGQRLSLFVGTHGPGGGNPIGWPR
jgi:hypothetical protein